jgi:hypothetical protein
MNSGIACSIYSRPSPAAHAVRDADPAADVPAAARPPEPRAPESSGSSRSAQQSQLPASSDTPAAFTDPRPHRQPDPSAAVHISAADPRPRSLSVFFDILSTRAIILMGKPATRCNRRISTKSSTDNIPFWSSCLGTDQATGPRGQTRFPRRGQFSRAADAVSASLSHVQLHFLQLLTVCCRGIGHAVRGQTLAQVSHLSKAL